MFVRHVYAWLALVVALWVFLPPIALGLFTFFGVLFCYHLLPQRFGLPPSEMPSYARKVVVQLIRQ